MLKGFQYLSKPKRNPRSNMTQRRCYSGILVANPPLVFTNRNQPQVQRQLVIEPKIKEETMKESSYSSFPIKQETLSRPASSTQTSMPQSTKELKAEIDKLRKNYAS